MTPGAGIRTSAIDGQLTNFLAHSGAVIAISVIAGIRAWRLGQASKTPDPRFP